ncbi:hypothetical protein BGZ54_006298, partial [Gamsiella multidivaricata]
SMTVSKTPAESTRSKVKYLTEAILSPDVLQEEFDDQESYIVLAIYPSIKSTVAAVVQFGKLRDTYQQHADSVFTVEKEIRVFCGSEGLKVARYRKKQGEKIEVGRAINGMLRAAQKGAKVGQRKPMAFIGDGDFKCKSGGPVKLHKLVPRP